MCDEIRELGIETFITANGGYAKHGREVIYKVPMENQLIKQIMEFSQIGKHSLSFFTEELSINGVKDPSQLKALKETLSLNDYPVINQFIHQQEVFLLCLYGNEETVDKYKKKFPHLIFKRWHPYIVNVLQEDVSKSLAIKKVLEYFNIDSSQAIAFGDGENDIDMLECVGLSIAMENGSTTLKSIADFVTRKSSEDGIEYALKKYGII